MTFAGIDIGSLTGKALLLEDSKIIASKVIRVKKTPVETAEKVFEMVLSESRIKRDDVAFIVSTGYGRDNIPFSNKSLATL